MFDWWLIGFVFRVCLSSAMPIAGQSNTSDVRSKPKSARASLKGARWKPNAKPLTRKRSGWYLSLSFSTCDVCSLLLCRGWFVRDVASAYGVVALVLCLSYSVTGLVCVAFILFLLLLLLLLLCRVRSANAWTRSLARWRPSGRRLSPSGRRARPSGSVW